jgi:hypothetical protein
MNDMIPLKIIFYAPGYTHARFLTIDRDNFHDQQALVGGLIATSAASDDGLLVAYNDEGLLDGLPPTLVTAGATLCGGIFFCRSDDEGNFADATEADLTTVEAFIENGKALTFEWDFASPNILMAEPNESFEDLHARAAANPLPRSRPTMLHLHPAIAGGFKYGR